MTEWATVGNRTCILHYCIVSEDDRKEKCICFEEKDLCYIDNFSGTGRSFEVNLATRPKDRSEKIANEKGVHCAITLTSTGRKHHP